MAAVTVTVPALMPVTSPSCVIVALPVPFSTDHCHSSASSTFRMFALSCTLSVRRSDLKSVGVVMYAPEIFFTASSALIAPALPVLSGQRLYASVGSSIASAVLVIALHTSSTVASLFADHKSAAMPATKGDAMEVPL